MAATGKTRTAKTRASAALGYRQARPDRLVLITGPEDYLAGISLALIKEQVRAHWPDVEVHDIDAGAYALGELAMLASPSLFASHKLIVASGLASMTDDFLADALRYCATPDPDVVFVMRHSGGQRGKKLLDLLKKKAGAAEQTVVIDCSPLKKDAEKLAFVENEVRAQNRRIEREALAKLITALGSSLPDLGSALKQLLLDVEGTITDRDVEKYYGGRAEATAFNVADAALKGQGDVAMVTLRRALATGVDPVPIVASLAIRLRQVASVLDSHEPSARLASSVGMAPWQVEQARRDARRFNHKHMVRAVQAIAEADYQVKGGAKDPIYALEKAILTISQR